MTLNCSKGDNIMETKVTCTTYRNFLKDGEVCSNIVDKIDMTLATAVEEAGKYLPNLSYQNFLKNINYGIVIEDDGFFWTELTVKENN